LIRPNLTRKTAARARRTAQASSEIRAAFFICAGVLIAYSSISACIRMGRFDGCAKKEKPTHIPVSGFLKTKAELLRRRSLAQNGGVWRRSNNTRHT
jgi:hypothetical protein